MSEEGEEFFYTYNVLNQLLTVEGSESKRYSYDKRGNLISQGVDGEVVTTYTYDSTNRLVNIQQEGGKCSQYSYNGLGHRVKRERKNRQEVGIFSNGMISTSSDYDEFGNLQYGKWDDGQPFGFTGYRREGLDSQYFG